MLRGSKLSTLSKRPILLTYLSGLSPCSKFLIVILMGYKKGGQITKINCESARDWGTFVALYENSSSIKKLHPRIICNHWKWLCKDIFRHDSKRPSSFNCWCRNLLITISKLGFLYHQAAQDHQKALVFVSLRLVPWIFTHFSKINFKFKNVFYFTKKALYSQIFLFSSSSSFFACQPLLTL